MNDFLEWLAAGLIFLSILGVYDARAALLDPGNVRCESLSQSTFVPPHRPSRTCMLASDSSAGSLSPRHDSLMAIARLLHRKPERSPA